MPFTYTGLVLPGNLTVRTGVVWGRHACTCKYTSGKRVLNDVLNRQCRSKGCWMYWNKGNPWVPLVVTEGKRSVFQSKELPTQACFYKHRKTSANQCVGCALVSFWKAKDNARKWNNVARQFSVLYERSKIWILLVSEQPQKTKILTNSEYWYTSEKGYNRTLVFYATWIKPKLTSNWLVVIN